jgi:glycosyltransferase involved in cell wall biosynthesis
MPASPTIEETPSAERQLRVHALIASLTWGGAEMLLSEFAAGAPAAGIELSVGFLEDRDGSPAALRLRDRGVEPSLAQIEGPLPLLNRSDHRVVRRQLEQIAPDVVHTHLGYADMLGGLAARSLGIPAVSTLHVMQWQRSIRAPKNFAKERLMSLVRRRCIDTVIAVSDAARAAYLDTGWDTPERVVTVRNGIVAEPVPGAGHAVREQLGIGPDELVIAMVTVLRAGKGHEIAAQALARLREQHPNMRLLVAGDGPDRERVERLATPPGDAMLMTGHRDDVMALMDASDVLLHPTFVDAFPTTLLEAMAAGLPVVATAVGGIPEIVEDGVTGVLVPAPPTADAVVEALAPLLDDAERRRELGAAGRKRFEREFTAEAYARRMRKIYENALGGRRPR